MTQKLPLTLALGLYDHTRDVTDGIVPVEGVDLRWLNLPIEEIFYRFILHREWDVSEVSMGKYTAMRAQDDTSITAMPVFISRAFRHSMFYVREGGEVSRPEDLQGKRVGVPEWAQTAGIYGRGWLSDYVGVPLASIEWVQAGVNQPGRIDKVKMKLPDAIRYRTVSDRSLNEMLLAGDLDAVMSARPPAGLGHGIVRLMPDYQPLEEQYFRETGIFPIMHSLVVQTKVLDANPWVAMNLVKAFEAAKNHALERLSEVTASHAPFAWMTDYHRRMQSIFGADPYPYGCSPVKDEGSQGQRLNWTTLDAFLRFGHEQGVCAKRLAPEQLFPKSTLSSFRV
jgi:4,5-dihydroxyphthalate decarboxylase